MDFRTRGRRRSKGEKGVMRSARRIWEFERI
jgi:hypothetical protein